MDRRTAIKLGTVLGLGGLTGVLSGKSAFDKRDPLLLGSARNCIFINTVGGMSHVDTFDYKRGADTPARYGETVLPSGALWPIGLMPKLAEQAHRFSLLRSLYGVERNHQRAQFAVETGHRFNPAASLRADIPALGALVALEMAERRRSDDVLPTFFAMGRRPPGTGMFARENGAYFLEVQGALPPFPDRIPLPKEEVLRRLDWVKVLDPLKQPHHDPLQSAYLWASAEALIEDERANAALTLSEARRLRYRPADDNDNYYFGGIGDLMAQAYQLLAADAGTRFIHIGYADWDHHARLYSILDFRMPFFDAALAALLTDLAETPGVAAGKTLLDETLVVVIGEFGRTPGPLNGSAGRDHFSDAFAALMAGGGVQGGRVVGATDAVGGTIVDTGWNADRAVGLVDVSATVFSALGIDYRRSLRDTPSGRTFYYVGRDSWAGNPQVIEPLFI